MKKEARLTTTRSCVVIPFHLPKTINNRVRGTFETRSLARAYFADNSSRVRGSFGLACVLLSLHKFRYLNSFTCAYW